jgi:glutamine synthetase
MSKTQTLWNYYDLKNLDQGEKIIAEYIWIDGSGLKTRSKARTLPGKVSSLAELPEWNFDGSSTEQAETGNSEVLLKPVAYFRDPFRGGDNILVLTQTFSVDRHTNTITPCNTNFRAFAERIFGEVED